MIPNCKVESRIPLAMRNKQYILALETIVYHFRKIVLNVFIKISFKGIIFFSYKNSLVGWTGQKNTSGGPVCIQTRYCEDRASF